jgi:hypothetical protein
MKLFGGLAVLALVLLASPVLASLPLTATLEEMVRASDHIIVGRVVRVDMIDGRGRTVRDESAHTGVGLDNVIRLHVAVDEVLVSNAPLVPKRLKVPLDPAMIYGLGQVRAAHADAREPFLLLLKGPAFKPILPGVFSRPLAERDLALELHAKHHP